MQGKSVILGHEFEATIYKKQEKLWISEEGRELEIIDYKPSKWFPSIQVVQRGVYHCAVGHKPTTGDYTGVSPLWRISHNVSRFATQIARLKTLLPAEHQPELDLMLEEISDGFHDASSEISRLNSKLIDVIKCSRSSGKIVVGREGADDELILEKKKVEDYEKLWKYRNHPKNGLPVLHYACLEGMSSSIIDMLVGEFGKEALESEAKIGREELKRLALPADVQSSWHATPIHLAIICAHVDLVRYLAQGYPQCIGFPMRYTTRFQTSVTFEYHDLAVSAFVSLDNFRAMRLIIADRMVRASETVQMAIFGGNLNLIQRLPSICSLSFEELFRKDHGLLWQYWHLASCEGHLSLVKWIFENFSAERLPRSLNGKDDSKSATSDTIDKFQSPEYLQSFWEWSKFKEMKLCEFAIGHLPILKWVCQTSTMTFDKCYHELSKSAAPWAAHRGSEDTVRWLSDNPGFDPSYLVQDSDSSAAHEACESDSDGILQLLFDWASGKRIGKSEPNLTFFHLRTRRKSHIAHIAAEYGSFKCLQWMTTHLEEFKGRKGQDYFLALKDENGASVLHMAAQSGCTRVLSWLHDTFKPNWTLVDNNGYQPIHYACNSLSTIQWLYETAGVTNLDVLTKDGHHVAWLAASNGNFEVLDFIVSKVGPSCLTHNENGLGFATVEKCIRQDPIRLLEWLVKVGYDFSLVDHNGNTFAHRIASDAYNNRHLTALEWLKAHSKLTFKEKNKSNKTALDLLNTNSSLSKLPLFAACMLKLSAK